MHIIELLQKWYKNTCKSEHSLGIQITTITDSSWYVIIDLFDTAYEDLDFKAINIHRDDENWLKCIKENNMFKGYGGINNLTDILSIFYDWITNT